jgi:hypothetical protein
MIPPLLLSVMLADARLVLTPILLLALAFWVCMLLDCASHEQGRTRIIWFLIILFLGEVGAPLYFILRRLPRRQSPAYRPPPGLYQPWRFK